MVIDATTYKKLFELFERECKRIEVYKTPGRKLTENKSKILEYKECLVETYNNILIFLNPLIDSLSLEDKIDYQNRTITNFKRLKECFQILAFEYTFEKNIRALIDINNITEQQNSATNTVTYSDRDSNSDSSTSSNSTVIDNSNSSLKDTNTTQNPQRPRENSESSENIEMAQTIKQLMQLATSTINYRYDGNPLNLESFIDAIELLKELCDVHNEAILLKFLMTRLEGKAREAILETPKEPDDIINQLKAAIKTEPSKVIEGRMLALRSDKTNLTKFAERAEELAEEYRRSLCNEGFSKAKAKELSIEKTVELCRKNTRSDTVNSIIASKQFSEPKEVIAKMIIEINNLKQFRNSSQYPHKNNNNKNGNSNNKFHKNNNRNPNSNSNDNRYGNSNKQNGNNGLQ